MFEQEFRIIPKPTEIRRCLLPGTKEIRLQKEYEKTSLYIHVPFCLKKCPYCDFYSVPAASADLDSYADFLIRHLHIISERSEPKKLESIFFGGGTPSLLSPKKVGRILETAEKWFGMTGDVEISLEANPGTVDRDKLADLCSAGVNRLSIGVQSLCDSKLHALGRIHRANEAEEAIRMARTAGFENLSCDLMFALPGQTVDELRADLAKILDHRPEHLSIYGLTVEEGTPFAQLEQQGELLLPDEDAYVEQYHLLREVLETVGYSHYEISNFAWPGYECRHNLRYWQRRENLAVGAGAHSFSSDGWGERRAVPANLERFAAAAEAGQDPAEVIERFDRQAAMAETLYLGLRTATGVDTVTFKSRFGVAVDRAFPDAVRKSTPYLHYEAGYWRLDVDGWLLFNSLLAHFY